MTKQRIDDEAAWAAVVARDRTRDGAFVFAVRSTRIYCRPSCPARRPRRVNVSFFRTPDDAERAGFRGCKRCLPRSAGGTMIDLCVEAARQYLDAHLDERVTLARLSRRVGVSPFHLQRAFAARVGLSPRAYVAARRIERFKSEVRKGMDVSEAIYEAGFGSPRGLYERAGSVLGMTPGAYRRGGEGTTVRYAVVECGVGRLLVGATERGVCAVLIGASERAVVAELAAELPAATRVRDDGALRDHVAAVLELIRTPGSGRAVSVDVRGTDFQRRVWSELARIPPGETRTYGEVARALGAPKSARAVARACAQNRLAVVVPCHRVVREDGGLAGYRWGVERKRALLTRERSEAGGELIDEADRPARSERLR